MPFSNHRFLHKILLQRDKLPSSWTRNNYFRIFGQISQRFNHAKSGMKNQAFPDGIYVQVLPVIRTSGKNNDRSIKSSDDVASECKILLCKWSSGDFKDRYTGLIKPLLRHEYNTVLEHHENGRSKEKHDILLDSAKSMIPSPLQSMLQEIHLVGLLRFHDPPVYDEYIYLANLIVPYNNGGNDSAKEKDFLQEKVSFGDNSCYWFSWDKIPFQEMPADDELWYPKVLQQREMIQGSFTFGGWSEKTIKSFELQSVQQIE